MDPERAAKRARIETAEGEAAGTSAAGPSGEQAENALTFGMLPDALWHRIMSLLGAVDVLEVSRLHQVDRRFRRLVHSMEWEQLRLESKLGGQLDVDDALARTAAYKELLDRMADRVRRGELKDLKRVSVSLAIGVRIPQPGAEGCLAEATEPTIIVSEAVLGLVSALAVAPAPPEHIELAGDWIHWPSEEAQVEADIPPRSLQDFASSLLVGLSPARALCSLKTSSGLALAVAKACVDLSPYCIPGASTLSEVVLASGYDKELRREHVAAVVQAWPALQRVEAHVWDGAALAELARLPSLEALTAHVHDCKDPDGLSRAVVSLAGADGAAARLRELWIVESPDDIISAPIVGPVGVAAALSLRSLQRLSIGVDPASAEAIGGLSSLEQLRELDLVLRLSKSEDRSAALLAATAAALGKARALDRVRLNIEDKAGVGGSPPVAGGLVALFRAARPALAALWLHASPSPASPEVLREVAACGPRLECATLFLALPEEAGVRELAPFRELLALSGDRPPRFRLHLYVAVPENERLSRSVAGTILKNWLHALPSIVVNIRWHLFT